MIVERRPWLGFFDPATGRREARSGLTIGKIYAVTNGQDCIGDTGSARHRPKSDWGPPILARDELYIRLRNDAGLSHQHATEFLAACPGYASIRHALDARRTTGEIMGCLVTWETTPQGHEFWSARAKRAGWLD